MIAPTLALGLLGIVTIAFPQLLGNGKDAVQLAFTNQVTPMLLLALLFLKPAATAMCLDSGVPGGLFTPSLALGALLGGYGLCLELAFAGRATRSICRDWCGSGIGRYHPRTHFSGSAADGADGPRSIVHSAAVVGGRHGHGSRSHHRPPFDL